MSRSRSRNGLAVESLDICKLCGPAGVVGVFQIRDVIRCIATTPELWFAEAGIPQIPHVGRPATTPVAKSCGAGGSRVSRVSPERAHAVEADFSSKERRETMLVLKR